MYNNPNPRVLLAGNCRVANDLYDFLSKAGISVLQLFSMEDCAIEGRFDFIIAFTEDELDVKLALLAGLQEFSKANTLISINIDGVGLQEVQVETGINVIGLNFNYPFSDSRYMEVVRTAQNSDEQVEAWLAFGRKQLNKDPYVVAQGISARAYMLGAMAREAFYLLDNGYANVESIDRACRNDAGYYMPFTGNYLYMDLMGTVAYALVMKDLNPELSSEDKLPTWFLDTVIQGDVGMQTLAGLYEYKPGDYERWEAILQEFSADINLLIKKYDQQYLKRTTHA